MPGTTGLLSTARKPAYSQRAEGLEQVVERTQDLDKKVRE